MDDYESGEGFSEDENITYLALSAGSDPIHYIKAAKSSRWRSCVDGSHPYTKSGCIHHEDNSY